MAFEEIGRLGAGFQGTVFLLQGVGRRVAMKALLPQSPGHQYIGLQNEMSLLKELNLLDDAEITHWNVNRKHFFPRLYAYWLQETYGLNAYNKKVKINTEEVIINKVN